MTFPSVPTDPLYVYKWVARDAVALKTASGAWEVAPAEELPGMKLNAVNGRIEAFGCVLLRQMHPLRSERAVQMTMRDHFALACITGFFSDRDIGFFTEAQRRDLAKSAYEIADSMLEARKP